MKRLRSLVTVAVVAASAVFVLSGCSSPGTPGESATPSPSESPADTVDLAAGWLDEGRMVALVTLGSSSCVPTVQDTAYADGVLTVELVDPADAACTADYVPRATAVGVPEGVDPADDLDIVVTGDYPAEVVLAGDPELTGVPGESTDGEPSARWAGNDGIVILTWGSSSCPPVVESAEATGPAEVTVTFVTPDEARACTMDFAPRVTFASVAGLEQPQGAELVLTGDGFDDVRVPITGTP